MGIKDKLKGIFGGEKDSCENTVPLRLGRAQCTEECEESDAGERWKTAKKWREQKAMQEPLVKRNEYKKKI
jgi:hypothetical protein